MELPREELLHLLELLCLLHLPLHQSDLLPLGLGVARQLLELDDLHLELGDLRLELLVC